LANLQVIIAAPQAIGVNGEEWKGLSGRH